MDCSSPLPRRRAGARAHGRRAVLRTLAAIVLMSAVSVGVVAAPASACACGVYVANVDTSVATERAAIKWDGSVEELVVSLEVLGESPDAGFILPLPAQADAGRVDASLFEELAARTAPRVEQVTNWWPNLRFLEMIGLVEADDTASGNAPGVEVLDQSELGDIILTQLAASDPNALAEWLTANGYQPQPGIATVAAPYAQAGWIFVAAKLTPLNPGETLGGDIQPIKLRFPSSEPVYPMRLSALAADPMDVELYVLAPNRMDPAFGAVPGEAPTLRYAGWLDPSNIGPVSQIGQWLTSETFLTAYDQVISEPSRISGDYTFAAASADEEYQTVVYVDRDLGWLTGGLLLVLGLTLLAVIPTRIMYRRRVRAERARYSSTPAA